MTPSAAPRRCAQPSTERDWLEAWVCNASGGHIYKVRVSTTPSPQQIFEPHYPTSSDKMTGRSDAWNANSPTALATSSKRSRVQSVWPSEGQSGIERNTQLPTQGGSLYRAVLDSIPGGVRVTIGPKLLLSQQSICPTIIGG
eukprot:2100815-Prymnesium_polylepis.1